MPTSANEVWSALAWGAVSSVGLLVGAIAGAFSRMSHHAIAIAMSAGAGLLLAAVSLRRRRLLRDVHLGRGLLVLPRREMVRFAQDFGGPKPTSLRI